MRYLILVLLATFSTLGYGQQTVNSLPAKCSDSDQVRINKPNGQSVGSEPVIVGIYTCDHTAGTSAYYPWVWNAPAGTVISIPDGEITTTKGNGRVIFALSGQQSSDVDFVFDIIKDWAYGPNFGVKFGANAFSDAPTCSSGIEGATKAFTDSTTITWGDTITGSGNLHVLGYCDGTNWTVIAK